jgi:hypothetical protein
LKKFEAPAYGRENTLVKIKLYKGDFIGKSKPSSEIVEIRYFGPDIDKKHLNSALK